MRWVEHYDIGDTVLVAVNVDNILFAEAVKTYRRGDLTTAPVDATRVCMANNVARVLDIPYHDFLVSIGLK